MATMVWQQCKNNIYFLCNPTIFILIFLLPMWGVVHSSAFDVVREMAPLYRLQWCLVSCGSWIMSYSGVMSTITVVPSDPAAVASYSAQVRGCGLTFDQHGQVNK